jgi:hypothetical protein
MCEFLSVCISIDTRRIYVGNLRSHSYTVEFHGLAPETYREIEWTGEDEKSLEVRVPPGDSPARYVAAILSKYPTRNDLLQYCLRNVPEKSGLDLSGTQITSLPDGLSVGGGLYLSGTRITSLPDGLSVGGDLYLSGTQITSLPDGLSVGGGLHLSGTQITSLPDGLSVGGGLHLSGTRIVVPAQFANKVYRY